MEINLDNLLLNDLTIPQFYLLYFLYHNDLERCKKMLGVSVAENAKNQLIYNQSEFIKTTDVTVIVPYVEINRQAVALLLGEKPHSIDFTEFYTIYPTTVGNRILRAGKKSSIKWLEAEKAYRKVVKNQLLHDKICSYTRKYLSLMKSQKNTMYLPTMENIINDRMWEHFFEICDKQSMKQVSSNSSNNLMI